MTQPATRTEGWRAGPDEVPFDTSGSTGAARRWFRLPRQMEREVELIGTQLVGPVDQVITYAPPQHLFGALFGQWLPRMAGVPVHRAWTDPLAPLSVPSGARVLIVCVPMAWNLLHRGRSALERARSVVALHSAAAPPPAAHRLVRWAGPLLRAWELLGSTETGGIAHRPVAPEGSGAAPWQALPDVTLMRDRGAPMGHTQELVVRSPRLARPEGGTRPPARWATGDLVEFTGDRSFRLVGRSSSLIKVNGVKVHLTRVEEQLRARLPHADCVALPLTGDPLAGEGYVIFWSGRRSGVDEADIRAALRDFPGPSRLVDLAAVPRTASGKPDRAALLATLPSCSQSLT
ncbi:acyl-CoA synthetase [Streptomyces sp. NPDC001544]|uniref:acyl-CoA synthetase n=1 Tax=Streptomyces sp. NPDC001544 TaxID=3364584 RepID=UPI0036C95AFB